MPVGECSLHSSLKIPDHPLKGPRTELPALLVTDTLGPSGRTLCAAATAKTKSRDAAFCAGLGRATLS
jgi:hypothetical protein